MEKDNTAARIVSTIVFGVIAVVLVGLIIFNSSDHKTIADKAWDVNTVLGDAETAKYHYIMYTDIMCPYCDVFSRLTIENEEEFEQYLADNKIAFEVRVTDMLYESNGQEFSKTSAHGAYCAASEGKFWEYYHNAISSLWDDYHSKGIGSSKTAPQISDMTDEYWLEIGHEVGLGETFDNCVTSEQFADLLYKNTVKASTAIYGGGLPYFQFGSFETSGFDPSWDYSYVQKYLDAGLSS